MRRDCWPTRTSWGRNRPVPDFRRSETMKWLLDLSTRSKLFFGFGLMIVLIAVVVATAYRGISVLSETQRKLYEHEFADERDMREVRSQQLATRADVAT